MGWADCGHDSKHRPIGYAFAARCDHAGCKAKIDRGLGYACGGMHGDHGFDCEGYFCGDHLVHRHSPDEQRGVQLCLKCSARHDEDKAEAFAGVLALITHLPTTGSGATLGYAIDKLKTQVYELLLGWDEVEDIKIDRRYMSETVATRLEGYAEVKRTYARTLPPMAPAP